MAIPKHLLEAKICNRETCVEVEQLNSLVNSCQEEIRRLKDCLEDSYETSQEIIKELEKENQRLKDINFKQEYELENRMMKIDYLECEVKRLNNVLNEYKNHLIKK